jgi:hypothetical protein
MRKMPNWLGLAWVPFAGLAQVCPQTAWAQQQAPATPAPTPGEAPSAVVEPSVQPTPAVPPVEGAPSAALTAPESEQAPPPADSTAAELAQLRAEVDELKAKQAEAEMAALLQEEPAEVEEDKYRIYGFMDMGAQYYAVDKSSLVGAVFDTNALSFVTGNIDLYFDFNPIEDWRALAEVRFTNAPQGDVVSYGGLAGDFQRTNTEQFDPHGTAPNAPMWGGYTVIEQAWIEWGRYQALRLRVGNWFTPFGIWNVDHGSPTLISMSMPQFIQQKWMPLRQTGVQALGSFFSGETEIGYRAWVSNGRTEQNPFDYDNEKSFGARLFVKRDTGETNFQVGATYHRGVVRDKQVNIVGFNPVRFDTPSTWEYTENVGGLDVSVDIGDTRIRSEGIISHIEYTPGKQESAGSIVPGAMQPNRFRVGAYALVAHQLPWLGLEPYLYAELIEQPWIVADGVFMPSAGLNVHFNPSTLLKLQYAPSYFFNWKHEAAGEASLNNVTSYMGRLVVAF